MKRMSKAEEALQKQVRNMEIEIEAMNSHISELLSNKETLYRVKNGLESEIGRLAAARRNASEKAKP